MSLALSLSGKYPVSGLLVKGPGPAEWLATLQEWLAAREGDDIVSLQQVEGPDGEVLLAQLHPFAEELQVTCPKTGEVALTAATGSCGPGYHDHVVELAHAMASELKVKWAPSADADDTGFFGSGDRGALDEAMREHVAGLAQALHRGLGDAPPNLLLPPTAPGFVHDGAVSTLLGPRDAAWLARVAEGGAEALEAMPWRSRGKLAETMLARALALLWCEVRWRAPVNETEETTQREALRCLLRAKELGATALPWREWSELLELAGEEGPLAEEVASKAKGARGVLAGYRRGDIIARVPAEFVIRIPGSFGEEVDEEGTWSATDGGRAVYVSAGRLPPVGDTPGDAVRALARAQFPGDAFEFRGERVVGKAGLRRDTDDDGKELWVLSCGAAHESFMLRATITFEDDADREWALQTFRSIDRGAPQGAAGGGIAGITSI